MSESLSLRCHNREGEDDAIHDFELRPRCPGRCCCAGWAAADLNAWNVYTKAMIDAGVLRGGNALKPGFTATTVRLRNGSREVHDGPYADSKEELGGYFVIDVPDLNAALQWAARNPAVSSGAVEVRPSLSV